MRREFRRRDDTVEAMFERADEALYAAGQAGRDQVVVARGRGGATRSPRVDGERRMLPAKPVPLLRPAAALVALLAASAVALQYALLLRLATDGFALATLRFLSYFTILSNLAVVATCVAAALGGRSWLADPRAHGAVALYIAVTGLVYVVVLRHLWQPQGLQWWADSGLHYATPLAYLAWWVWRVPHGSLRWRDLGAWLLFPLAFLGWTLLRGAWLAEYPYPFIDVGTLGVAVALRNAAGICVVFVALGALLVALDRSLGRRARA